MPTASRPSACRKAATIGRNFAWRSYFHGGPRDLTRPGGRRRASTSRARRSPTCSARRPPRSGPWPSARRCSTSRRRRSVLGVVAMTVEVGRFVEFPGGDNQFAVLVDNRDGRAQGRGVAASAVRQAAGQSGDRSQFSPRRRRNRPLGEICALLPTSSRATASPPTTCPTPASGRNITATRWRPTRKAGNTTGSGLPRWSRSASAARHRLDRDRARGLRHGHRRDVAELTGGLIRSGAVALGLIAMVMAGLWGMAKRMSAREIERRGIRGLRDLRNQGLNAATECVACRLRLRKQTFLASILLNDLMKGTVV